MTSPVILFHQLAHAVDLPLPQKQTQGASGLDLCAAVPMNEPYILKPHSWGMIPTGLTLAIPEGYEGQVRARSGLAFKHGIGLLNGPGTIDADYRGELGVILFNFSDQPFTIKRGDRIAQLVITKVEHMQWLSVEELPKTQRGEGGFGHTGR